MESEVGKQDVGEVVIDFVGGGKEAIGLVRGVFDQEEIIEGKAFSGSYTVSVILGTVGVGLRKFVDFWSLHRTQFKDARLKIGKDDVSLQGYSVEELKNILDTGHIETILKLLKTSKK